MADGSLVGTHQPPLEKGDDTVGARQQVFAFRLIPLHLSIMIIAGQIKIGWQPMASQIGISITTTGTTISTDLVPPDDPWPCGKRGLRSFSSPGASPDPPKAPYGLPTAFLGIIFPGTRPRSQAGPPMTLGKHAR
jgi:hypothetical protein